MHRIHSGQVILSLESALKELVENALDAGATQIDVRIKDGGLESLEVIDNGSGISEHDWENVGLKHRTSKLSHFDDLSSVTTFGFRGEALSALCALSASVEIITAINETAPLGRVLRFDKTGKLIDSSGKVARQRGTTVIARGLFQPLPVRRKEFERNSKRELARALGLLTAYGLVPAAGGGGGQDCGVRLVVDTVSKTGKRTNHLRTDGKSSLRSAVSSIWGSKSLENLIDLDLELSVEIDRAMAKRENLDLVSQTVLVKGLISSAAFGSGRTSNDRQYFYLNGRPFNPSKIARVVNDTYRTFNTNQSPFVVLDFQIPRDAVDVNVSPDKRDIYVHSEGNLLEALRIGLDALWQPSRSTFIDVGFSQVIQSTRKRVTSTEEKGQKLEEDGPVAEHLPDDQVKEGSCNNANRGSSPLSDVIHGSTRRRTRSISISPSLSPQLAPRRIDSAVERIAANEDRISAEAIDDTEDEDSVSGTSKPALIHSNVRDPDAQAAKPTGRLLQTTLTNSFQSWNRTSTSNSSSVGSLGKRRRFDSPSQGEEAADNSSRQQLRSRLANFASHGQPVKLDELPDQRSLSANESDESEDMVVDAEDDEHAESSDDDSSSEIAGGISRAASQSGAQPDQRVEDDEQDVNFDMYLVGETEASEDTQPSPLGIPSKATELTDAEDQGDGIDYIAEASAEDDSQALPQESSYRDEIFSKGGTRHVAMHCILQDIKSSASLWASSSVEMPEPAPDDDAHNDLLAAGVEQEASEAEKTLSHVIMKKDFAEMEVLGQFNKCFIIARRSMNGQETRADSDDLFIIGEHLHLFLGVCMAS